MWAGRSLSHAAGCWWCPTFGSRWWDHSGILMTGWGGEEDPCQTKAQKSQTDARRKSNLTSSASYLAWHGTISHYPQSSCWQCHRNPWVLSGAFEYVNELKLKKTGVNLSRQTAETSPADKLLSCPVCLSFRPAYEVGAVEQVGLPGNVSLWVWLMLKRHQGSSAALLLSCISVTAVDLCLRGTM